MEEIWKDVFGYENKYHVSNLGRVKSLDRKVASNNNGFAVKKGVHLKEGSDKDGYKFINLKEKQKGNKQRVHRLVAIAFIANPENKPHVNHKNGVKFDNRLENLEWATLSENRTHAYKTGLQNGLNRRGEKCNFNKVSKEMVLEIRSAYESGSLQKELAVKYNLSQAGISAIVTRKNWSYL